jgi:hypothetical protein
MTTLCRARFAVGCINEPEHGGSEIGPRSHVEVVNEVGPRTPSSCVGLAFLCLNITSCWGRGGGVQLVDSVVRM